MSVSDKKHSYTFEDLIGQEAMVRTLKNAFTSGRIAHAFMLTGVRGVGKTTTARIIARALNCVGPDGKGGPTVEPCGVCDNCKAISEDRHVDVIEMDAASRTGIDDVRELIEGVRYRPVGAAALLRRNLAIYGLGGLVVPFIGIKLIDWLLVAVHLV